MTECTVKSVVLYDGDSEPHEESIRCDEKHPVAEDDVMSVELRSEIDGGKYTKLTFTFKRQVVEIEANVVLMTEDRKYVVNLLTD